MFGSSTSLPPDVQAALGKLNPGRGAGFPPEHEAEFAEMQAASSAADASLVTTAVAAGLLFHLLLIGERQFLGLQPNFFLLRGLPLTIGLVVLIALSAHRRFRVAARALLVVEAAGAIAALVSHVAFGDLSALLAVEAGTAALVLLFSWVPRLSVGWTALVAGSMIVSDALSLGVDSLDDPRLAASVIARIHALSAPIFAGAFALLCASVRQAEARRDFLALRTAAMSELGQPVPAEESRHLDPQSLVANREAFEIRFRAAWEHAAGRRNSVALLLFGIDHLPVLRRELGNKFTDTLEREVAKTLKDGLRRSDDMVARFDPHHFVVMLPGVGTDGATQIAERLRGSIEELVVYLGAERRRATVTVGVASLRARRGTERVRLIEAATAALDQGKNFGTNLVYVEGRGCLPAMV